MAYGSGSLFIPPEPGTGLAGLRRMRDDLPNSYVLEPGRLDAELANAVQWALKQRPDEQLENLAGEVGRLVPLRDLKELRDMGAAGGYRRPDRIHTSAAHRCDPCDTKAVELGFYGKSWTHAGNDAKASTQRHVPPELQELLCEVKRAFWPVMNDASKKAEYNTCVITIYRGNEKIAEHTDTRHAPHEQVANVEGAAVLSACVGDSMELWTRRFLSKPGDKKKLDRNQHFAADLVSGGAFCWDAGAPGSDDWAVQHSVWPKKDAGPTSMRVAFVFRAMKPEYKREYSRKWPHRAVV